MYRKVFKNSQITYGVPFQVRIPLNLQNELLEEDDSLKDQDDVSGGNEAESPESILAKAREESDMIIKEAEYEAARIMDEAKKQALEKACSLEEEAWRKGYEEGLEAARQQCEDTIREAGAIRESASEEHDKVLAGMEAEIIDLVMELAKKVIGREMETNRDYVISLAANALEGCSNTNGTRLRVSPDDYEFLAENREKLMSVLEDAGEIEIKNDPSLKKGSCIAETPFGNVDGGVRTKLRKIEEAFMEVLEGR